MKHKTFQESQVLIAKDLEIKIHQAAKTTCQADESVRLEMTFSKEQWQKLEKMRSLISHSLPNGSEIPGCGNFECSWGPAAKKLKA